MMSPFTRAKTVRILSQIFSCIPWLLLLLGLDPGLSSAILRIDPLVAIVAIGGTRIWVPALVLGLATLALSALLGRAFCGWICPLGGLFDLWGWILSKFNARITGPSTKWFRFKYYFLFFILITAVWSGASPLMGLDPVALLSRAGAAMVAHLPDGLTLILLLSLLFATTSLSRIWCRVICPLGALLGVVSRNAILRRTTQGCIHCNLCIRHCPTGAIQQENAETATESECIKCFTCSDVCPVDANVFRIRSPLAARTATYSPISLDRRGVLTSAMLALVSVPMLKLTGTSKKTLIRPPMSKDEGDFLLTCIRCAQCVRACPTGVLTPAGFEHGWVALWSPVVNPTAGYCLYERKSRDDGSVTREGCSLCSDVCPTSAINKYPKEKKSRFKMGTAVFENCRCISFGENKFCSECVRACPTDAIKLSPGWEPEGGLHRARASDTPLAPDLVPARPAIISFERCVGCGECVFACDQIVSGEPAILLTSFGRATPTQL